MRPKGGSWTRVITMVARRVPDSRAGSLIMLQPRDEHGGLHYHSRSTASGGYRHGRDDCQRRPYRRRSGILAIPPRGCPTSRLSRRRRASPMEGEVLGGDDGHGSRCTSGQALESGPQAQLNGLAGSYGLECTPRRTPIALLPHGDHALELVLCVYFLQILH